MIIPATHPATHPATRRVFHAPVRGTPEVTGIGHKKGFFDLPGTKKSSDWWLGFEPL